MAAARILLKDPEGKKVPFCDLEQVLLATTLAPWADLLKIEHHLVGPGEIAASAPEDFLIVQRMNSPDEIEYRVGGESWKKRIIRPGELDLIPAGTEHSVRWGKPAEVVVLSLNAAFVTDVAAKCAGTHHLELRYALGLKDVQLEHIVSALHSELLQGCPSGRLFGESLATALVLRIARRDSGPAAEVRKHAGGLSPARLRRVVDYIDAHLLDDTSLSELAAAADLSPHHFASLFKKTVGVAPHQYVIAQRIEIAKRLLKDDRKSLSDIAHETGFPSQAHFSTVFRKITGISPHVYRIRTAD